MKASYFYLKKILQVFERTGKERGSRITFKTTIHTLLTNGLCAKFAGEGRVKEGREECQSETRNRSRKLRLDGRKGEGAGDTPF